MRRPLAVIGFTYFAALAIAFFVGSIAFWVIVPAALFAVFAFLIGRFRKTRFIPAISVTILSALVVFSLCNTQRLEPAERIRGEKAYVSGRLSELPVSQYGRYYYQLDADTIKTDQGKSFPEAKIIVSSGKPLNVDMYDRVKADVRISRTIKTSDISKGILFRGSIDTSSQVKIDKSEAKPPAYYALLLRKTVSDQLMVLFPEKQGAAATALITSDKLMLPDEVTQDLRRAGLSHIVVVSGYHVTVIASILFAFFLMITHRRKRPAAIMCAAAVFGYMMMVGFTPSVSRAGIMLIILLIGIACFRQADSINSLGAAVLLIILINPFAAIDVGLMLSFSATLGILLVSGRIVKYLNDRLYTGKWEMLTCRFYTKTVRPCLKAIISVFAVSFSAMLFTLPVRILCFQQITPYSVIANMLIAPALSLLIPLLMLILALHFSVLLDFLCLPFVLVSSGLISYIFAVAGTIASLPFSQINVARDFVPVWLLFSIAVLSVLLWLKKKSIAVRIHGLAVFLSFIILMLFNSAINYSIIRIAVLDTGDGLSVVITSHDRAAVLLCGGDYGGYGAVRSYLEANNVRSLSYLLLTDNSDESSLYTQELLKSYPVAAAEVYDEQAFSEGVHSELKKCNNLILRSSGSHESNTTYIDGWRIESNVGKKASFISVDIDGIRLLLCTDGTDCGSIPDQLRNGRFLIINGDVTNIDVLDYSDLLISDSRDNKQIYDRLPLSGRNVYQTFDGGNIIIRCRSGASEIRRENVWLS